MRAASMGCYWEAAAMVGMIFGVDAHHGWMNIAETLQLIGPLYWQLIKESDHYYKWNKSSYIIAMRQ